MSVRYVDSHWCSTIERAQAAELRPVSEKGMGSTEVQRKEWSCSVTWREQSWSLRSGLLKWGLWYWSLPSKWLAKNSGSIPNSSPRMLITAGERSSAIIIVPLRFSSFLASVMYCLRSLSVWQCQGPQPVPIGISLTSVGKEGSGPSIGITNAVFGESTKLRRISRLGWRFCLSSTLSL